MGKVTAIDVRDEGKGGEVQNAAVVPLAEDGAVVLDTDFKDPDQGAIAKVTAIDVRDEGKGGLVQTPAVVPLAEDGAVVSDTDFKDPDEGATPKVTAIDVRDKGNSGLVQTAAVVPLAEDRAVVSDTDFKDPDEGATAKVTAIDVRDEGKGGLVQTAAVVPLADERAVVSDFRKGVEGESMPTVAANSEVVSPQTVRECGTQDTAATTNSLSKTALEWVNAYSQEKGAPPRDPNQLRAFVINRNGSIWYSTARDLVCKEEFLPTSAPRASPERMPNTARTGQKGGA